MVPSRGVAFSDDGVMGENPSIILNSWLPLLDFPLPNIDLQ